jgi:hypothetical protein
MPRKNVGAAKRVYEGATAETWMPCWQSAIRTWSGQIELVASEVVPLISAG